MDNYSFVIITDDREPEKLKREIASIHAQRIPTYEVIVVHDKEHEGRLGHLRNAGCRQAQYQQLIVMDDDMILHPDFYPGLLRYGINYDALSCVILNPDYTRYWDWKAHENGGNWLLDYGETDPRVSLTGGFCVLQRTVWLNVGGWDEELRIYQAEDVDFSNRLKAQGYRIEFNPWSTVTHDGPYTQYQRGVLKVV